MLRKFFAPIVLCCVVAAVLMVLPAEEVVAQGLVPACPVGEPGCAEAYAPDNYGVCELVQLSNNIVRFLIGLIAVLGALIMVYAGYLLVSSRGNVSQMERAKQMFSNILIGIVIMLSAFLVVNTVMSILVGSNTSLLNWNNIDCGYARDAGTSNVTFDPITTHTNRILSDAEYAVILSSVSSVSLASAAGACTDGNIARIWGNLSSQANCIITQESSCGASPISRSDIGADNNPFSFGAMQINTTVHVIRGCGHLNIPDLNCHDAWGGTDYAARVTNPALYQQCRNALLNNECNMINGRRIYREAGNSWRPWSTARACGLR